jgi:hypothetical protein
MDLVVYMGNWREVSLDSTIDQSIEYGRIGMVQWKNYAN